MYVVVVLLAGFLGFHWMQCILWSPTRTCQSTVQSHGLATLYNINVAATTFSSRLHCFILAKFAVMQMLIQTQQLLYDSNERVKYNTHCVNTESCDSMNKAGVRPKHWNSLEECIKSGELLNHMERSSKEEICIA